MDSLYVPYVDSQVKLIDAISQMALLESPALLVSMMAKHYLFPSAKVFDSYSEDKKNFCFELAVDDGYETAPLTTISLLNLIPPVSIPNNISDLFESMLVQLKLRYGFLYPDWDSSISRYVLIITQREHYKRAIVGTNTICVCTGPNRHRKNDLKKNEKPCDFCPPNIYKCTTAQ